MKQVSVGVGSDTVDVEVRPIKTMRSFAVEAKPTMVHRGYQTEKGYQKDIAVGTVKEPVIHKGVNTVPATTFPAATNTEIVQYVNSGCGTELKIFQAMDQVRNVASNTPIVQKYSFGVNTDEPPKTPTHDRAIATQKEFTFNRGMNTEPPRVSHMGVGNEDVRKKMEPEKPPTRHAAVGIRPNLADKGVGDGAISHSDVYGDATRREEEDEVQHAQESMVQAQKVVTTRATRSRYGYNENDNNNLARYGLEREEDRLVTGSSPESTGGSSSRYTVETHTTRSYGLGPGRTETTRTTKTYGSGLEPSTKTTEYTTTKKSSSSYGSSADEDVSGGYLARYGRPGAGGYSRTTTTTTTSSRGGSGGTDDIPTDDDKSGSYGHSSVTTTTTKSSRGLTGGSTWGGSSSSSSRGGTTSSRYEYDTEGSTGAGGDAGQEVEWVTDAAGNTQMKVIRNVETTYVGNRPVHQSSNVVIQDDGSGEESTGTVRRVMKTEQEMPERDISPGSFSSSDQNQQ